MLLTSERHSSLFKMMEPLKNLCLAHCSLPIFNSYQLISFGHCISNLIPKCDVCASFCTLWHHILTCDKNTDFKHWPWMRKVMKWALNMPGHAVTCQNMFSAAASMGSVFYLKDEVSLHTFRSGLVYSKISCLTNLSITQPCDWTKCLVLARYNTRDLFHLHLYIITSHISKTKVLSVLFCGSFTLSVFQHMSTLKYLT
jgi:hypothetical protein